MKTQRLNIEYLRYRNDFANVIAEWKGGKWVIAKDLSDDFPRSDCKENEREGVQQIGNENGTVNDESVLRNQWKRKWFCAYHFFEILTTLKIDSNGDTN